jgi:hypothetical protein
MVFALEAAKDGAKLKHTAADGKPSLSVNSNAATVTLHATKISMKDFAATLARQMGRPVEDRTALAGSSISTSYGRAIRLPTRRRRLCLRRFRGWVCGCFRLRGRWE